MKSISSKIILKNVRWLYIIELSTSDLIQLISIMVAIITGITSIAISIITL